MPIGALAKALRRSAGGSAPTTSITLTSLLSLPHSCAGPQGSSCVTGTPIDALHVTEAFRVAPSGDGAGGRMRAER